MSGEDVSVRFGGETGGLDTASARAASDIKSVSGSADGLRGTFSRLGNETKTAARSFGTMAGQAHVSSIAIRESLVLVREASVGNWTRFAGSMSILLQATSKTGHGLRGFATDLLNLTKIIKTTRDAELTEEAASAMAAANGVRAAGERSAAALMAADTEIALAQAQVRSAVTATEEAAAQVRLAAANEASAVAAAENAVAQNALAVASAREAEATAAAEATKKISLGSTGVILARFAVIAGIAYSAFNRFQEQVKDDGTLTKYRDGLGLTHKEMLKLGEGVEKTDSKIKKLGEVTVTFGDVMAGVWETAKGRIVDLAKSPAWAEIASVGSKTFDFILKVVRNTFAAVGAAFAGTFNLFLVIWNKFPSAMGDLFIQAVNLAIKGINSLLKTAVDGVNWFIDKVNSVSGQHLVDNIAPPAGIAEVSNRWAGAAASAGKQIVDGYSKTFKHTAGAYDRFWSDAEKSAIKHRENIMKDEADALKADRTPKKGRKPPKDHTAEKELAAYLEMKRAEQDAAEDDYAKKLAIEDEMLAAIAKVYGKDSKQYQSELRNKEKLERDWAKKKDEIARQSIVNQQKIDENTLSTQKSVNEAKLQMERDRVENEAAIGRISDLQKQKALQQLTQQELDAERQYEEEVYQVKLKSLEDQLKLKTLSRDEFQKLLNEEIALIREHENQVAVIEAQAAQKSAAAQQQVLQASVAKFKNLLSPISEGFNSMLQGMLTRTQGWKQGLISMADGLIGHWIQKGVEWAANWAAMELAKTSATAAGVAIRTSTEASGAATGDAISLASALKQIAHKAAVAAAGAYAAIASIPVVGPFLAPAAAAAALYGVYRLASAVFSAREGAGEVANDGDMYQLHRKEMVLPAKFANPLRDMLTGPRQSNLAGASANAGSEARATNNRGGDASFHYGPTVNHQSSSLQELLRTEGRHMRKWFQNEVRNGSLKTVVSGR